MLTVPHALAGAAIGVSLATAPGAPVLAFGLGWASHYVLDTVPHWENLFGKEIYGFKSGTPLSKLPKITIASGVVDFIAAVAVIFLILRVQADTVFWQSPIFWGALGGFLPDLLDNVPIVNNFFIKIPGVAQERKFHVRIHISEENRRKYPYILGLLTQLAVIVLSLIIIL